MQESGRSAGHKGVWVVAGVLLALAIVGTIWVPIYARTTPALGGFPFFYWYQLLWIPLVAILSWIAYLLVRRTGQDTGRRDGSR